jgi:4'-phosphopantetheinyl transferase
MTNTGLSAWFPSVERIFLNVDEVHIWQIQLDQPILPITELEGYLSPDELERAHRFRFPIHSQRFVVARGSIRKILARYLDAYPGELRFSYSPYGKPALETEFGGDKICFNLSHSHALGLLGVTRRRAVGVDIEYIRADLADIQVARRFFSSREVETLLSLPAEVQKDAFFNCWTRKEAFIKAIGEGLSMPLDRFDVSLAPGDPPNLLATRPDPAQALQWKLYDIHPGPGYAAAMAVQGEVSRVINFQGNG